MNILMTGCSSSVGGCVRERLQDKGHSVFGVGLGGPNFDYDFLDRTVQPEVMVSSCFSDAKQYFSGDIDALVLNAGITRIDFLPLHEYEDFTDVLHVNLTMPFLFCREFIRHLIDRRETGNRRYRIVASSSMGASETLRASPGYCASKAGLEAMIKVIAKENAGKLPLVASCLAFAGIQGTDMIKQVASEMQRTRGMSEHEAHRYAENNSFGRNMLYEEVWKMFEYALEEMPVFCSGTVLTVPGGSGR